MGSSVKQVCTQLLEIRFWILLLDIINMFAIAAAMGFCISMLEVPPVSTYPGLKCTADNIYACSNNMVDLIVFINLCWIHLAFSVCPIIAEYQNNYRWYYPWIFILGVYIALEFLLATYCLYARSFLELAYVGAEFGLTIVFVILSNLRQNEMKISGEAQLLQSSVSPQMSVL